MLAPLLVLTFVLGHLARPDDPHSREEKHKQSGRKASSNWPCPPHGPHLIGAVEEGLYVARRLTYGLTGLKRKDGLEAKLAFDQTLH